MKLLTHLIHLTYFVYWNKLLTRIATQKAFTWKIEGPVYSHPSLLNSRLSR